jgi:hypothetical protein
MGGEVYGVARRRPRAGPARLDQLCRRGGGGAEPRRRQLRRRGWARKKRSISRDASGPLGSVYEPSGAPPDQACDASSTSQCSASVGASAPAFAARQTVRRTRRWPAAVLPETFSATASMPSSAAAMTASPLAAVTVASASP